MWGRLSSSVVFIDPSMCSRKSGSQQGRLAGILDLLTLFKRDPVITCCSSGTLRGAVKSGMTYWPRAGALYMKCCSAVVPTAPPPAAAGMLGMCSRPRPGTFNAALIACRNEISMIRVTG